jgi:ABC-type phosphate transport system substrate-binding protein
MDGKIVIATVLLALALSAFVGAGLDGVGEARPPAGPDLTQASAAGTTMSGDFAPTTYAAAERKPASRAS